MSCVPTSPRRPSRPRSTSRACRRATGCSSTCSRPSTCPFLTGVVEAEVHQHLEGENRLDDDEHRAEVDEYTGRRSRHSSCSTPSPRSSRSASSSPSSSNTRHERPAVRHGPNEFAQTIDQQGQIPSIVQEVGAARRWPRCSTRTVTDTAGGAVDLNALVAEDQTHYDYHGSAEAADVAGDDAGDDAAASADEAPAAEGPPPPPGPD